MPETGQSSPRSASAEAEARLAELRRRIDAIDSGLLAALNERARLVLEVGRVKGVAGATVYSAAREQEIVERLERENPGPFPDRGIRPVFREIISATRSLEALLRVAYLGPAGTWSHAAAGEQFGEAADLLPQLGIADVFASVERGTADLGVVPIENTTDGIVTQTYDLLPEFEGTLCGELQIRVSHSLLSQSGRLDQVKRVVSHPQPLAQCRGWLDRHLPGVPRVEAASTVTAAQLAAADPGVAAIASPLAGAACGLRAIESGIEDRRDNTTRFLVIGRQAPAPSGQDLTAVVFTLRKDESGALFRLLEPFAGCRVNLTSLHLRPIKGKPWEYLFFVEFEGHQSDARVTEALASASAVANSSRVLGSFPRARARRE